MPLKALSANCDVLMVYIAAVIAALPKSNYKTSSLQAPVTSNDGLRIAAAALSGTKRTLITQICNYKSYIILAFISATRRLDAAEYYRFGPSLTCQQVLSEAQAAAATVRPKHAALVTEAGNIRWDGLPLV